MTKVASALLAVLAIAAGGCSMPSVGIEKLDDIPEAEISRIDAVKELQSAVPAGSETLGTVEGVSCRRAYKGTPASWDDAIRRTKYRALQLGANAIAELSCDYPKTKSMSTMCLDSIRCKATAVRVAP